MDDVCWLLDEATFARYHDEFAGAVVRGGCLLASVSRPNPPYTWDDVDRAYQNSFKAGACVVTHGDIDLVMRVLEERRWLPGAFASVGKLSFSTYSRPFGEYLLNSDYELLPFGEFQLASDDLFERIGRDGRLFVRPDSTLKQFPGLVVSRSTFAQDFEIMQFHDCPADALIVASSPKEIEFEWRFVVVDGSVVSGSLYKNLGERDYRPDVPDRVQDFATMVARHGFAPDAAWTLDVCQTADRELRLLEIGAFSFSDLYACNKDLIVAAVSKAAFRIWRDSRVPPANDRRKGIRNRSN